MMTTIVRDWRDVGPREPMPRDDAVVWNVWLDAEAAPPVLAEEENDRARRFRFDTDRRRFAASRAALRTVLAAYVGVAARDVALTTMAGGKPCLDPSRHEPSLRFSVSHSGDRALIALVVGREVGVDVERIRMMPGMDDVARRFFSLGEQRMLEALADDARMRAFFRIWTLKEAYLKGCGDGLRRRLDAIDVMPAADGRPSSLVVRDRPGDEKRWTLRSIDVGDTYAAALAIERRPEDQCVGGTGG